MPNGGYTVITPRPLAQPPTFRQRLGSERRMRASPCRLDLAVTTVWQTPEQRRPRTVSADNCGKPRTVRRGSSGSISSRAHSASRHSHVTTDSYKGAIGLLVAALVEVTTHFCGSLTSRAGARVQPPKPRITPQLSNGCPVLGLFRPDRDTIASDLIVFLIDVFRGTIWRAAGGRRSSTAYPSRGGGAHERIER